MPDSTFQELDNFLAVHPQINSFDLLLPDINGMLRGVRATRDEMRQIANRVGPIHPIVFEDIYYP